MLQIRFQAQYYLCVITAMNYYCVFFLSSSLMSCVFIISFQVTFLFLNDFYARCVLAFFLRLNTCIQILIQILTMRGTNTIVVVIICFKTFFCPFIVAALSPMMSLINFLFLITAYRRKNPLFVISR